HLGRARAAQGSIPPRSCRRLILAVVRLSSENSGFVAKLLTKGQEPSCPFLFCCHFTRPRASRASFLHGKSSVDAQPAGSSASSTTNTGNPSLILKRKAQRSHRSWSPSRVSFDWLGLSGQRKIATRSARVIAR